MFPYKNHIEQIDRFHKIMSENQKELNEKKDNIEELKGSNICYKYFLLTELWVDIDDFMIKLKNKLDSIEYENNQ